MAAVSVPRRELRLDRRARDEGDAVAGLDGASHRLLQPELEPDVEVAQARADRAQLVLDDLADAGALLHHDQALAAQLLQRDGPPRERMAGRAREDDLVVEERLEGDRAVAAGRADDPELELARGDALDHRLRVGDRQRDRTPGCSRWNSQSRSGTTMAAGPVDAPSCSSPESSPSPSPAISSRICPSSVSRRWAPR